MDVVHPGLVASKDMSFSVERYLPANLRVRVTGARSENKNSRIFRFFFATSACGRSRQIFLPCIWKEMQETRAVICVELNTPYVHWIERCAWKLCLNEYTQSLVLIFAGSP